MSSYLIGWGVAFVIFAILEALTPQLVSIWFALGSFAAFVAAMLNASLPVQLVIFVVVSIAALIVTRPLAKRLLNKRVATNADRLIGKIGYVIEPIDNFKEKGRVMIEHQDWSARTIDGAKLKKGTNVVIKRIEGVKLMVSVATPEDYQGNVPQEEDEN